MATGPAFVIPAPALTPPPTGLLRTATVVEHGDDLHWGGALEWGPEGCGNAQVLDPCASAAKGSTGNRPAKIRYDAFLVEAHDICSTFGFLAGDYEARARRLLAARESKAVEAEWWVGTLFPANPHLAKTAGANGINATTLAAGVAQTLRIGLSLLIQHLADNNGGVGMIHARPFLVEMWSGLQLLYRDGGGKLWTYTGNQVVAGTGYPGSGPTGQAISGSSEWAFATDEVIVHRGPVWVPAGGVDETTVDYANNSVQLRAERQYALATDSCVLGAVNINPTLTS